MKKKLVVPLLLLGLAAPFAACGSDGNDGPVTAFPSPGAEQANVETQISFRGASSGDLDGIEVTGSESGTVEGEITEHGDDEGASFIPAQPFDEDEQVTVKTDLDIEGGEDGDFTFTTFVSGRATVPPGGLPPEPAGDNVTEGEQKDSEFVSNPDLDPPPITVNVEGNETADGDIFLAPKSDGKMILDNNGELIWYDPGETADFRVQEYKGEPVMTWWQGNWDTILAGFANGAFQIMDENYELVTSVQAGNGFRGNLHEFLITPEDTALITIYEPVRTDLTSVDGPDDGVVMDSVIQEIDIETGAVLFEWHSLDHVGVEEGMTPFTEGSSYDYFHINSIKEDTDGNLIVSARNTFAIYKIDRETGEVIWRLGGKESDFPLDEETTFTAQHDAQRTSDGYISLFDNGAFSPEPDGAVRDLSRGLVLDVNEEDMTVDVVREYEQEGYLSPTQGNFQELPNGNVMIGWGSTPAFTEFTKDGEMLFSAGVTARNSSYRVYRHEWQGTPQTEPDLAVRRNSGETTAYVSWNGSTEVDGWQVMTGPDADSLEATGDVVAKDGFETDIPLPDADAFVAVAAVDSDGATLSTSSAVEASN